MSGFGFKVKVEKDVFVSMRDGVRLAVDVYRPDSYGRFPALLSMSPYGKEVQSYLAAPLPPPQPGFAPCNEASIEAGDAEYFVQHGYVHVIADLRGTGYSEGEYEVLFSKKDGEDGYDLVEWIAQQPWCNGNVGMVGICYFATEQLLTAAEQPPHLKAICPWEIYGDDLYVRGAYLGGVLSLFMYGLYYGAQPPRCGFAAKNVVSATVKKTPKDQLNQLFQEALTNPDLRQYPYLYHLLKYPERNPILIDFMLNPRDGEFYWERSICNRADRIKVPTYLGGPWQPNLVGFFAAAAINMYHRIKAPKKLWLWDEMDPRPWKARHDEILRWMDYWLKGINTGIMDEPPIKLSIFKTGRWRQYTEWPTKQVVWKKLYLGSFNRLIEPENFLEETSHYDKPDCFFQQPLYVSPKKEVIRYSSSRLSANLEMLGRPVLHFYAEIDQPDTTFRADLIDENEGNVFYVTSAWLKASHRKIDVEKSTDWELRHQHTNPTPIKQGEINEYKMQMQPMSYMFKAGHRIILEISSTIVPTDPEVVATGGRTIYLCNSQPTLHKIYRDKERPSHLLIPCIK
ncbi:MAG: CocE/NonD family hydrolase [Candidatus Bathyarchaeia archaeon]